MAVDQDASETSKRLASLALQANNVCTSKTHMAHLLLAPLALHLYELASLAKEMQREAEIRGAGLPISYTKDMDSHVKAAEQLVQNFSGRSSLYLLMCCPDLLRQLKQIYGPLKATLASFCSDAGWSESLKGRFSDEIHALEQSIFTKLDPKEQSLHDSLEQGILDSIVTDAALTIKLAKQISEALGFSSLDSEGFESEVGKLKLEKDGAQRRHGMGHALYLQQFITLLEKAMAATSNKVNRLPNSTRVEDKVHHLKSGSGGGGAGGAGSPAMRDTLVLPLQSFICPITKDVMKDPVQIASGQTYERQAIQRWFADGHTRCPTGVELANTNMKSNIALKQSIAEWKDRNNSIRLEVATETLMNSAIKEHQLKSLGDLQALCQEDSLYKYRVASKSQLVPLLLGLAESGDLELSVDALSLLGLLAENEECQRLMVEEKVIELIVRCLARRNDEAVQYCVQLMRILSSNQEVAKEIAGAPSAVLFLVTLIQDEQCAHNVDTILDNLPKSDENVVIMAKANMMKPLIERLNHGEDASKVLMAKTLARLHMPDSSKAIAATEETITTLVSMAESSIEEEREAALMALDSLSCLVAARQGLRKVGALGTLLNVLKGVRHSEAAKRGSAATLANLWADDDFRMSDAEVEDAVRIILELLGPITPVQVQVYMLQGLLALARRSSNVARDKMKNNDAFTCLLRLLGVLSSSVNEPSSAVLRWPCLELLACLASSFRDEAARTTHSNPAAIHALANLIRLENPREAELLATTSFFACLPSKDEDITRLMLSESGFLHALTGLLKNHRNEAVVEAAAGALLRFTLPDNLSMQGTLAKAGVIETYVGLLRSGGVVSKERAAKALCNFSKSSWQLSHAAGEVTQPAGVWACLAGGGGRGWRRRSRGQSMCRVHGGQCSVEGTFCLVEADAVGALGEVVRTEGADGSGAQAAALMALATLVEQGDVEEGCGAIERAGGWSAIIGLMASSKPQMQEKAAHLCEKLFSIPRYRTQYSARAQMHIITLAQRGPPPLKQLAGRLLRHLELLHSQSDYFGVASITTS